MSDQPDPMTPAQIAALDMPGGLAVRECSPGVLLAHEEVSAVHVGKVCVVGRLVGPWAGLVLEGCSVVVSVPTEAIALDMTHETGLQHAALYCFEQGPDGWTMDDYTVIYDAACGRPGNPARLREIVLMIAALIEHRAEQLAAYEAEAE